MTALGGGGTLVLSIAAGTPLAAFEAAFGAGTPVVRAMPNTPAAIGRGITAIVGNAARPRRISPWPRRCCPPWARSSAWRPRTQIDAVTGVSGSGPAYVFHLIECLAAAAEAEGLTPDLALRLARATVAGAGALALETGDGPGQAAPRRDLARTGPRRRGSGC